MVEEILLLYSGGEKEILLVPTPEVPQRLSDVIRRRDILAVIFYSHMAEDGPPLAPKDHAPLEEVRIT
jgi:hypothetical protein